jgi:hypothetical protein
MSGVECLSTTACSSPNGVVKPWGGFGGVYYDFRNFGPIRIGVDLRAGGLHSNRSASSSSGGSNITSAQTFLGGLRGSVKTPIKWLSPYAQVSAGYTRSNVTEPVNGSLATSATDATPPRTYDGFVQYEGFVGADVHVFPFLDVRPIEVGIGNMNRSGTGNGSTSIGLMSIGAGVVLRFGH